MNETNTQNSEAQNQTPNMADKGLFDVADTETTTSNSQVSSQEMAKTTEGEQRAKEDEDTATQLILGKFKTTNDLAKSYHELEKKLGAFTGSPEKYSLENIAGIDENSPYLHKFMEFAKENNISQAAFDGILKPYIDFEKSKEVNKDEELRKLGPDAAAQITNLRGWAVNNLAEDELEIFKDVVNQGADKIKLLQRLRELSVSTPIPTGNQAITPPRTYKEIQQEYIVGNYEKYKNDSSYREKVKKLLAESIEK